MSRPFYLSTCETMLCAALLGLALSGLTGSVASAAPVSAERACRVVLVAGAEIDGVIETLHPDRMVVAVAGGPAEGRSIAYHEIREIRFASALGPNVVPASSAERGAPRDGPAARAFVQFGGGELLPAKVLESDGSSLAILVRGARTAEVPFGESIGELTVPLAAVRGFRLREPSAHDAAFETALNGDPPLADAVFVRRDERLLRYDGLFRRVDTEYLRLEFRDRVGRIPRNLIQGVVFAPVAAAVEVVEGYEGTLAIAGGGRLPAVLAGLESDASGTWLAVTVAGRRWRLPLREVRSIGFASERIRFLSDLEPVHVEETPFLGAESFPLRRDMSVGGEPLRLGGVEYRKGLGIHARTVLEYELGGDYATFLARVGIHDGLGAQGAAAVEVLGDGASLASGVVRAGGDALEVSVRIAGVRRLRIETDFGEDGHGLGDQVDWAEARVVKDSRRAGGDDDRRNAEAEGEAEAEEPREQ